MTRGAARVASPVPAESQSSSSALKTIGCAISDRTGTIAVSARGTNATGPAIIAGVPTPPVCCCTYRASASSCAAPLVAVSTKFGFVVPYTSCILCMPISGRMFAAASGATLPVRNLPASDIPVGTLITGPGTSAASYPIQRLNCVSPISPSPSFDVSAYCFWLIGNPVSIGLGPMGFTNAFVGSSYTALPPSDGTPLTMLGSPAPQSVATPDGAALPTFCQNSSAFAFPPSVRLHAIDPVKNPSMSVLPTGPCRTRAADATAPVPAAAGASTAPMTSPPPQSATPAAIEGRTSSGAVLRAYPVP